MNMPKNVESYFLKFIFVVILGIVFTSEAYSLSPNWEEELVQAMSISGGGPIVIDTNNNPIISYPQRSFSPPGKLRLSYRQEDKWSFADIDNFPSSMQYAGMPNPSLAIGPLDIWGVAYCVENPDDLLNGKLLFASGTGLNFEKETVLENWSHAGDTQSSLKYSPSGEPVIAYVEGFPFKDLRLAWRKGNTWDFQIVIDSQTITSHPSLAFTTEGSPVIAYATLDGLFAARYVKTPEEGWLIETIESSSGSNVSYHSISLVCSAVGDLGVSYVKDLGVGTQEDDTVKFAIYDGNDWRTSSVEHSDQIGIYRTFLDFGENSKPFITWGLEKVYTDIYKVYNGIRFAKRVGLVWEIETVEEGYDLGIAPYGLAVDQNGFPCLSFTRFCTVYFARYKNNVIVQKPQAMPWIPLLLLDN